MSLTLRNQLNLLKVIASIKDENVRKKVLQSVKKDKNIFSSIREVAKNTVNGVISLSKKTETIPKKYKRTITKIACSKKNCKHRCKLVEQCNGFLPVLIPTVLSLLLSMLLK